ncbi:MAG: hypothetical protein JXA42_10905, partial [Anaerolineales bacterium]|nr:hypothetical protein [Anaerolineales bacterium]
PSQSSETASSNPAATAPAAATEPARDPAATPTKEPTFTGAPPNPTATLLPEKAQDQTQTASPSNTPAVAAYLSQEIQPTIYQQASFDQNGALVDVDRSKIHNESEEQTPRENNEPSIEKTFSFSTLLVIMVGIVGIGIGFGLALFVNRQR